MKRVKENYSLWTKQAIVEKVMSPSLILFKPTLQAITLLLISSNKYFTSMPLFSFKKIMFDALRQIPNSAKDCHSL